MKIAPLALLCFGFLFFILTDSLPISVQQDDDHRSNNNNVIPDLKQKKAPVWPFQWNSTLAKINPVTPHIWWTKLYYDFYQNASRFDFYNEYYSTNNDWQLNCSILFTNDQIWFVFPDEQCNLDHDGIPNSKLLAT